MWLEVKLGNKEIWTISVNGLNYITQSFWWHCVRNQKELSPEYFCISGKEKGFPFESEPEGKQEVVEKIKNCFYKVLWKMKKKLSEQRIIVAYGKYPQRAWRTWLCGGHYLKALSFSPVRFICPKIEIQRKQVALALLFVDLGQNSKSTERMMELFTQTWRNW